MGACLNLGKIENGSVSEVFRKFPKGTRTQPILHRKSQAMARWKAKMTNFRVILVSRQEMLQMPHNLFVVHFRKCMRNVSTVFPQCFHHDQIAPGLNQYLTESAKRWLDGKPR